MFYAWLEEQAADVPLVERLFNELYEITKKGHNRRRFSDLRRKIVVSTGARMTSVNKVIVAGNLGRDPEMRTFPSTLGEVLLWKEDDCIFPAPVPFSVATRKGAAERSKRRRERLHHGWAGLRSLASSFFSNRKPDLRNAP